MSSKNHKSARERILDTAGRLFYAEGIRAVGIDRVIAEASVAKMTLYNHFKSKDDLVLAVLRQREVEVMGFFQDRMSADVAQGTSRLDAFFNALSEWFASPEFRGCAFVNTAVEMANPSHPASRVVSDHVKAFERYIVEAAVETLGDEAAQWGPTLSILVEGAIVVSQLHDDPGAAEVARHAAKTLLTQSTGR